MTKLITLLCSILLLAGVANAQSYTFSKRTETYADLDGGRSINENDVWDEDLDKAIPLGFTFRLFGDPVDTLYFLTSNQLTNSFERSDDEFSGHLVVPGSYALVDRAVADGANTPSKSPVTYQVTGNAPSRIGVIEWENAGFSYDVSDERASTLYTNVQLWLYEADGTMEIHYGPNEAGTDMDLTEPIVALLKDYLYSDSQDQETFAEFSYLSGASANPIFMQIPVGDDLDEYEFELDDYPAPNTVYRFTATEPSGLFGPAAEVTSFDVFPNPTADRFHLRLPADLTDRVVQVGVFDVSGRRVADLPVLHGGPLDLSGLPGGLYQLRLRTDTGLTLAGRVVKQ